MPALGQKTSLANTKQNAHQSATGLPAAEPSVLTSSGLGHTYTQTYAWPVVTG